MSANIYQARIPILKRRQGYYLRWWYNGWHYWYFYAGSLMLKTTGEDYRTHGQRSITVSSGQLTQSQANAVRTVANSTEVYLFTDTGWRLVRLAADTIQVQNNIVNGYELEFVLDIGSRIISATGFSPVDDVPISPPDDQCEIIIGEQVWMCRNWDAPYPLSKVYDNDEESRTDYGGLYTSAMVHSTGFTPTGWRLPTLADWQKLFDYVGGISQAGGQLKTTGLLYWETPNTDAVDAYHFNARGAGTWDEDFGLYSVWGSVNIFGFIAGAAVPMTPANITNGDPTFHVINGDGDVQLGHFVAPITGTYAFQHYCIFLTGHADIRLYKNGIDQGLMAYTAVGIFGVGSQYDKTIALGAGDDVYFTTTPYFYQFWQLRITSITGTVKDRRWTGRKRVGTYWMQRIVETGFDSLKKYYVQFDYDSGEAKIKYLPQDFIEAIGEDVIYRSLRLIKDTPAPQTPFTFTTTHVGALSLYLAGTGIVTIDWGDGSATEQHSLGSRALYPHTFAAGTHEVTIYGAAAVTRFECQFGDITDVDFEQLINIEFIELSVNQLTALQTYSTWTKLRFIELQLNPITSLDTFATWVNLYYFDISSTLITAIETHKEWVLLHDFGAVGTGISSIQTHPEWTVIELFHIGITNVTSFVIHPEWTILRSVSAGSNDITDVNIINAIILTLYNNTTVPLWDVNMDLSGGTNAAPTGAALAAKNDIIALGGICNTN